MKGGIQMEEILRVENLRKTFVLSKKQQRLEKTKEKQKKQMDGISFTAYRGEVFGLLGPNGAGKTTTLRMLATLIRPDEGDALIEGISVCKDPAGVRERIGFLTSELKLEEFFTPNYLFDFFAELHDVDPEIRDRRKRSCLPNSASMNLPEVKVANPFHRYEAEGIPGDFYRS